MEKLTLKSHINRSKEQFKDSFEVDHMSELDDFYDFIEAKIKQAWTIGKIESSLSKEERIDYFHGILDLEEVQDKTKGKTKELVTQFLSKFSGLYAIK